MEDNILNNDESIEIPSPEEMLLRLKKVDVNYFNIREIANELKGNHIWISVMTVPVSAIVLVSATLVGGFVFDSPIISFLVTAAFLFWLGRMYEGQEQNYRMAARHEVARRIQQIEGEFGLLYHFRHFLPNKYRHLWQSVRRGNYTYIEQYVQAVLLLQKKLEPEQFTRIWYMTYPEIDPNPELTNETS